MPAKPKQLPASTEAPDAEALVPEPVVTSGVPVKGYHGGGKVGRRRWGGGRLSERARARLGNDIESVVPAEELEAIFDQRAVTDDRYRVAIELFMTPPGAGMPVMRLRTALKKAGLSPIEAMEAITQHRLALGLLKMSEHMPAIMEDVAIDARSADETCLTCSGEGQLDHATGKGDQATVTRIVCRDCRGHGTIRIKGDTENRKLAMEITGMSRKGAGVVINQSIGTPAMGTESFESLIGRAGKVIETVAAPTAASEE